MKIRSIIVDDEPLARKGLREYVADIEFLELIGEFDNALQASEIIGKGSVQLILLDIEMPKITGLDFFRSLPHPPPVIFTTAYPQYALEGFEVNALDYLVKPVSFDRFLKACMKAREFYEIRQKNEEDIVSKESDHFYIKADNKLIRLNYDDILFAEALQNYVVIHTRERRYITYLTFRAVEEYLPSHLFIKTHKSYIVSASKIDSIEANDIRIDVHHIPISRNCKDDVMERLLKGKMLKRD